MSDLPIELDCFLIKWGFLEPQWAAGSQRHAPVHIAEPVVDDIRSVRGWVPSYAGEEPPF